MISSHCPVYTLLHCLYNGPPESQMHMLIKIFRPLIYGMLTFFLAWTTGCGKRSPEVVVYTALDQIFSEPVFKEFERASGIKVKAVYDTEASKTVGLANRLLAEARHPRCDVFWNNEIIHTILLQQKGVLEPYDSPSARDIADIWKDPEHHWTGIAARARVLIFNTNLVAAGQAPTSIRDLTRPEWKRKAALAYPLFGTTATHAAALFALWGEAEARSFFASLINNEIQVFDGNASVKDAVCRGEVPVGLTDTDDAYVAVCQGNPVAFIPLDQKEDQVGTLVIPNTIALVRDGPHPAEARKLIDFLLDKKVEHMLAVSGSAQMPVRPGIPVAERALSIHSIKPMQVPWDSVAGQVQAANRILSELFVR